jgi:hypothetical protein
MEFDKHFVLSMFHILFIVPFFLFVGFQRAATPNWVYSTLMAVGAVILFYHGYKLFLRLRSGSGYAWVNAIHMVAVAPLLIYIGYHGKDTPRPAYEILLMLAFAAAGYHLFSLVKMMEAHPQLESKEKN